MISFEQLTLILILCYGLSTLSGILGMVWRQRWLRVSASALAILGFAVQTLDMMRGSHTLMPGGLSWGIYLQILAWFMILCALVGQWKVRHTTPIIFITPLALMLFLFSRRFLHVQINLPQSLDGPFYALHIGALYFSLALMALAFVAGLVFLHVERKIKLKEPLMGFFKDFPALAILDKINAYTTMLGFPLFTVGILAGFIWAGGAFGKSVSGDPKEVVSLFIWIVYAWLFHMRVIQGRGGRKPAVLALWLFGLSVFSIFVVNTFMDTHHSFTQQ